MRAAGWMVLVVVALLASPRHALGYSAQGEKKGDTHEPLVEEDEMVDEEDEMTEEDELYEYDTDTNSTTDDNVTTSTDGVITPTDTPTTTKLPSLDDLELYKMTQEELNEIETTLDKFLTLVNEDPSLRSLSGGEGADHPAGWWKAGKVNTALKDADFCIKQSGDLCNELKGHLEITQGLISGLNNDVETWNEEKLHKLTAESDAMLDVYDEAEVDTASFKDSIKKKEFTSAIEEVQQTLQESQDKVNGKISDLTPADDSGSLVLVVVLGTVCGVMVVSLLGVMMYGAAKKGKLKKAKSSSTTPYNKLQGEQIPIDGFLSDAPRIDPQPRHPVPASRSDPYVSSYGPSRNEAEYRGPTITRVGQGLPRTHF